MPSGPSVSQRPVVPMQMVPMQGGFQPVQPFLMRTIFVKFGILPTVNSNFVFLIQMVDRCNR
jgi:hypothetical protein